MKNLFVLPTDKPSRLFVYDGKLGLAKGFQFGSDAIQNQKIYITNDEKIKEGDWVLNPIYKTVYQWLTNADIIFDRIDAKKIILTTDPELIKDGVQAIDDEFLEWFVKNPSCDEVEIVKGFPDGTNYGYNFLDYKIIIPKEEPKQETLEEASKDYIENTMKFSFNSLETKTQANRMLKCAEFGAKWQTKRMYSEEEVEEIVSKLMHEVHCGDIVCTEYVIDFKLSPRKWLENFKKK